MVDSRRKEFEQSDLGAIIAEEITNSQTYNENTSTNGWPDKRSLALEYMRGEMRDLPPRRNGSWQTSRDLADTVSWMLPGIIRVFTSSDTMVEFEPERESDVEYARQATDYLNYVFFKDNEGYRIIYNGTYDSLVMGNGVARVYWDPTIKTETETLYYLTEMQIADLQEEQGVRILTAEQNEQPEMIPQEAPEPPSSTEGQQPTQANLGDPNAAPTEPAPPQAMQAMDMETGEVIMVPTPTWNVKVERELRRGKLCIETCKPENLLLDNLATTIDAARAVGYDHDTKTRSDLIEMGFDREIVEDLPSFGWVDDSEVSQARNGDRVMTSSSPVKSGDIVRLYEYYIKIDVDGDGIAELVQVWYAGGAGPGKVLEWKVWEDPIPFVDIPCYPVPHRWDAQSVADRVMDIQRVKTVLLRQGLDNTYAANIPMQEVEEGTVLNPDILVNPKFGGLIWKKKGSAPIIPHTIAFTADKSFATMQYMDSVIARRTGVSDTMMALDPEALSNQTATASQNNRDAAYSQVELIARNHAELGWSKLFTKALQIIVKRQDRPRMIKLREDFVEMDPRGWNANMTASVNVGLGTGSKDRDMAMLNNIYQNQMTLAAQLGQTPGADKKSLEFLPRMIKTLTKIAESGGMRNPEAYYPDIDEDDVEAIYAAGKAEEEAQANAGNDAATQKQQADQQEAQAKMAMQQQENQAKLQMQQEQSAAQMQADMQRYQAQLAMEQEKIQSDATLRREQMMIDAQIKREQLNAELTLKREQLIAELQLKKELAMMGAVIDANSSSEVNVGGEPG